MRNNIIFSHSWVKNSGCHCTKSAFRSNYSVQTGPNIAI